MNDLARIRFVAGQFYYLQGLRLVPFGLWTVAFAAGWFGRQGDCTFSLPTLILVIILYKLVGVYYDRHFGRVERSLADRRLDWISLAVAIPAIWLAVWIDATGRLPISLLALALAGFLLVVHLRSPGGYRRYYAVLAALLALLSLTPLALGQAPKDVSPPVLAALGGAYIVGGVLDHLVLARSLKPAP